MKQDLTIAIAMIIATSISEKHHAHAGWPEIMSNCLCCNIALDDDIDYVVIASDRNGHEPEPLVCLRCWEELTSQS